MNFLNFFKGSQLWLIGLAEWLCSLLHACCRPAGPTRPRHCTCCMQHACCSLQGSAGQPRSCAGQSARCSAPQPPGSAALLLGRTAHAHTWPRLALAPAVRLLPRRRSPLRDEPAEVELGIWPVDWGMEFPCEWRGNGWPVDRVGSRCWNWASTIWAKTKNGWAFCSGWPNNGDGGRLQP